MRHLLLGVGVLLSSTPIQAQLATPNDLGVAFGHMHLGVTDIDRDTELWIAMFDAVDAEKGGYAAVQMPGALIFLTEAEPTSPSRGTVVDHFGLRVRDIGGILTEWRSLGYPVDAEFRGADGSPAAYVRMPDGARLELQEDRSLAVKATMHHVHFYTPENRELLTWYADLFGATPRARGNIETTADVPGSNLSFSPSETERPGTEGTAIDHIGFEVADLEAFAENLVNRGITLDFGPVYIEGIDLWVAFFTDESGVSVEVTQGMDTWLRRD